MPSEDNKIDTEIKRFVHTSRAFYLNVPVAVFELLGWEPDKLYVRKFKIKKGDDGKKVLLIEVKPSRDQ
jgi:hypothetical protein